MVSLNMHTQLNSIQTNEMGLQRLKNSEMPEGWQIYIARLVDDGLSGNRFCMQGYLPISLEDWALSFNFTYFCIGKVIFLTVSSISDYTSVYVKCGSSLDSIIENFHFRSVWPKNESASKTKRKSLNPIDIARLHCFIGR